MKFLWPDWYFDSFSHIPEGFFKKNGIKTLICDIDNTLVTYDDPIPTPKALSFFKRLEQENVSLLLVSNNNAQRVNTFIEGTSFPAISKASKPLKGKIVKKMEELCLQKAHCAVMGDQLLTDALAAKNLKVPVILLNPIKSDKGKPFFKLKRAIERVILMGYLKKHPLNDEKGRGRR
ncbi:MAG: YqeG family HAD IIIA-type phosphatase [Clostridia bacterium]|nr:YqeG family HAD IIIA-type phosphatase [Clostridia bacterium]